MNVTVDHVLKLAFAVRNKDGSYWLPNGRDDKLFVDVTSEYWSLCDFNAEPINNGIGAESLAAILGIRDFTIAEDCPVDFTVAELPCGTLVVCDVWRNGVCSWTHPIAR